MTAQCSFSKCYKIVSGLIDLELEKEGAGRKEPSGRDNGRTRETTLGDAGELGSRDPASLLTTL